MNGKCGESCEQRAPAFESADVAAFPLSSVPSVSDFIDVCRNEGDS